MHTALASISVTAFGVVILYAAYLVLGHPPFLTRMDVTVAGIIGGFAAMLLLLDNAPAE